MAPVKKKGEIKFAGYYFGDKQAFFLPFFFPFGECSGKGAVKGVWVQSMYIMVVMS